MDGARYYVVVISNVHTESEEKLAVRRSLKIHRHLNLHRPSSRSISLSLSRPLFTSYINYIRNGGPSLSLSIEYIYREGGLGMID